VENVLIVEERSLCSRYTFSTEPVLLEEETTLPERNGQSHCRAELSAERKVSSFQTNMFQLFSFYFVSGFVPKICKYTVSKRQNTNLAKVDGVAATG